MSKPTRKQNAETRLAHAGREPARYHGFVNTPIYRGSTVLFPTLASLEANTQDFTYGRLGTPTVKALEEAIAELEGGHRTLLTPSGLSAIAAALLAFVSGGDEVLVSDSVYQPTRRFCDHVLKRLGVRTIYYDPLVGGAIKDLLGDRTKVVFTELPGSQSFEVQDIPAIAEAAHPSRRGGHHGQYLGDTAVLQAVCPRGRCLDPGRHQIHRRPCRRHARRHHRQRQYGARGRGDARRSRPLPRTGGRLSRFEGPQDLSRQARAASGLRVAAGEVAVAAARGCARDPPWPARRSRAMLYGRGISPAPPVCSPSR